MSLTDELLKHAKHVNENSSLNPNNNIQSAVEEFKSRFSILDEPIGQITSRDQIINPYDLVDPSLYRQTRRGQAAYKNDLERAKLYAQQQEAAYKEWFESPEQVYARERQAGRNPDITDVMNQESGSVNMPEGSPIDNIPTNGEVAISALGSLGSIASVFSSVSSIMGTISQIGLNQAHKDLVKSQADGQFLANLRSFISESSQAISNKLATALSSDDFDMDDFFSGDFSDILSSITPSYDSRYAIAFNRILKDSKKVHSDAYAALGEHENRRKMYLEQISSSYYSLDDDEMTGQLSIIVRAHEELDKISTQLSQDIADIKSKYIQNIDPVAAADALNAQNEYTEDYYSAMDAEIMAKLQQAALTYDTVVKKSSADVYRHLNRLYNSSVLKFFPEVQQRIGWQILAGANLGWQDHLYSVGDSRFSFIIDEIVSSIEHNRNMDSVAAKEAHDNRVQTYLKLIPWYNGSLSIGKFK